MADETNETPKPKKRRLRASSETVRERREKLQLEAEKPVTKGPVRSFFRGFFAPLRALFRLIGKLGRFRVFRWIGYVLLPVYVRNSWRELKLVTWPNFKSTMALVWAVVVFSLIFGLIVFGVDLGLDKLFKEFIVK